MDRSLPPERRGSDTLCSGWERSATLELARLGVLEANTSWREGRSQLITLSAALVLGSGCSVPDGDGGAEDRLNGGSGEVHHPCLWQVGLLQLPQDLHLLFSVLWEREREMMCSSWVMVEPRKREDSSVDGGGVTRGHLSLHEHFYWTYWIALRECCTYELLPVTASCALLGSQDVVFYFPYKHPQILICPATQLQAKYGSMCFSFPCIPDILYA